MFAVIAEVNVLVDVFLRVVLVVEIQDQCAVACFPGTAPDALGIVDHHAILIFSDEIIGDLTTIIPGVDVALVILRGAFLKRRDQVASVLVEHVAVYIHMNINAVLIPTVFDE